MFNVSILNVHNVKANSVDPDQTGHYEQFDQDLHYLPISFVHSTSALVKYSCPLNQLWPKMTVFPVP